MLREKLRRFHLENIQNIDSECTEFKYYQFQRCHCHLSFVLYIMKICDLETIINQKTPDALGSAADIFNFDQNSLSLLYF